MNKKGFTLIELLAVIVILAIIALIATPIVLNIIKDSRESAGLRSAEMYLDAVEQAVSIEKMDNTSFNPNSCEITNGDLICDEDKENPIEVKVNGDVPKSGTITFENGKIKDVTLNYSNNKTIIKNIEGKLVYGEKKKTLAEKIIEDAEANNYLYTTPPDFNTVTADGEFGLYSAKDDYGISYYFRGDVENNYLKFGNATNIYEAYIPSDPADTMYASMVFNSKANCEAIGSDAQLWTTCVEYTEDNLYSSGTMEVELEMQGFSSQEICETISSSTCTSTSIKRGTIIETIYWRIVRINGDGTVRLVYDGKELVENGTIHTATIALTAYNSSYFAEKYIGYTHDDGTGTQVDSTIKGVVDTWYAKNLESDYGKYIADSIFCNDREVTRTTEVEKFYGAYDRLRNKKPSIKCTDKADRYTVNDTTNGNNILSNPVGLLTADEALIAGGTDNSSNTTYYLYSGEDYWTMSPSKYSSGVAMWYVGDNGKLFGTDSAANYFGARPVINLKADVEFTGTGTIDDPYVIVTE